MPLLTWNIDDWYNIIPLPKKYVVPLQPITSTKFNTLSCMWFINSCTEWFSLAITRLYALGWTEMFIKLSINCTFHSTQIERVIQIDPSINCCVHQRQCISSFCRLNSYNTLWLLNDLSKLFLYNWKLYIFNSFTKSIVFLYGKSLQWRLQIIICGYAVQVVNYSFMSLTHVI